MVQLKVEGCRLQSDEGVLKNSVGLRAKSLGSRIESEERRKFLLSSNPLILVLEGRIQNLRIR